MSQISSLKLVDVQCEVIGQVPFGAIPDKLLNGGSYTLRLLSRVSDEVRTFSDRTLRDRVINFDRT